jgi:hypothetical protein
MICVFTELRFFPALLVFLALILTSACISKEKDAAMPSPSISPAVSDAPTTAPSPDIAVAGGFVTIFKNSPGARRAHEFLRETLAKKNPGLELGDVTEAASQVVAGVKTRLTCEYTETANRGQKKLLVAVVFIDLHSNESLLDLTLDVPGKK